MAEIDLERMKKYRSIIKQAGLTCNVDPALIAGIISRESRAGNQLINGWGDNSKAFGLMQVDSNAAHSFLFSKEIRILRTLMIWFLQVDVTPPPRGGGVKPVGKWDSVEHLIQATGRLVHFINWMKNNFRNWTPNQHLQGLS